MSTPNPTDLTLRRFEGRDGAPLVYRELGEGRTVVLLHGYLGTGPEQWLRYRHAALLAERGHRVVLPDLRGHGDSATPHDAAAYPLDVMTDDGLALVEQLGVADYDLGGYSIGARTTLRMITRGATPGRAVVAGVGLQPILDSAGRGARFRHFFANLGGFEPGSWEARLEAHLTRTGADPVALLHVLDTLPDMSRDDLARIATPTLVLIGADDRDHGSAEELAAALADGRHLLVSGDHTTAIAAPELGAALADFLD